MIYQANQHIHLIFLNLIIITNFPADPDKYDEQNSGFKMRQKIYCLDNDIVMFGVHSVPLYVSKEKVYTVIEFFFPN